MFHYLCIQVNKEGLENLPPEKRKKAFKEKIKEIEVLHHVTRVYSFIDYQLAAMQAFSGSCSSHDLF